MRFRLPRPVAEARLGSVARLSMVKPTGDHGDVVLEIEDQRTGDIIGAPVCFTHDAAHALLGTHFHATADYLERVLSDEYAQQYYDALRGDDAA
jgi:hypothetical protein